MLDTARQWQGFYKRRISPIFEITTNFRKSTNQIKNPGSKISGLNRSARCRALVTALIAKYPEFVDHQVKPKAKFSTLKFEPFIVMGRNFQIRAINDRTEPLGGELLIY